MSSSSRKYLIFTLSGELYALDLSQVAEVREPQPHWPVPLTPPCYRGAMNFHGAIVAVMDLAAFLGFPARREPEKLIVLDSDIGALAFMVEQVVRIVSADQVETVTTADERFIQAMIMLPEGLRAGLLDALAITEQATASINTPRATT